MMIRRELGNELDPERLPRHVAVIMDGNGRWAQKRFMPRFMGHRAGMEALKRTVKTCRELGIAYLTVYAFSTENWKRPREEVSYLMNLLLEYVGSELAELKNNGVRVNTIGDIEGLPARCRDEILRACRETQDNSGMIFTIAINYGSRHEITNAVMEIVREVREGKIGIESLNEELFASYLDTNDLPDPDLVIRTAGEKRLSNFLLWQTAYSELYFTEVLWPDFDREHLIKALADYQKRERRFGGLTRREAE